MVKCERCARNHHRHSTEAADEKVNRDLPGPDRGFDHGLTVVTWLARNRAAGNIDTVTSDNAFFPSFLTESLQALFVGSTVCHTHCWGAHASSVFVSASCRNAGAPAGMPAIARWKRALPR